MPRLAWLTDIHLNFVADPDIVRLAAEVAACGADAVVISGDIAEAHSLEPLLSRFAEQVGGTVYFVLGNHDFYHGSIADVRARAQALTRADGGLKWLPACGLVRLSDRTALLGHDGWGDARLGDCEGTPVVLNDFIVIEELSGLAKQALHRELRRLGDESAAWVRHHLPAAAAAYQEVLFVTHVPPFRESCWHEGAISDDNWLPFFACKAVGDALLEAAHAHPQCRITVVCGHTHSSGQVHMGPNLRVITGAADYGAPVVQKPLIELP